NSYTFYNNRIEEDYTVSGNIFGSISFGFPIVILAIPFKTVFSPSLGLSASFNEKTASLQDINGDGLIDVILKDNNNNNSNISARLNKVGKTHLLKQVNTATGGYWEIGYAKAGNTYNLPNHKWVLS